MRGFSIFQRILSCLIIISFLNSTLFPSSGFTQSLAQVLPAAGTMVTLSESYHPAVINGITVHPDNPLQFDFLIDSGDSALQGDALKAEAQKMINYFLTTLTVPDNEMWVNLSPYEKDRIIADGLGQTEMGRDMLIQDYFLKQLTSSLMYPEGETGKKFWEKIYAVGESAGVSVQDAINTFNKVWIVPESASVYIHDNNVFVASSHLKVMLESDYLAQQQSGLSSIFKSDLTTKGNGFRRPTEVPDMRGVEARDDSFVKNIIRDVILPIIEEEVNHGKTFANLRQIYNSMLLATWYKRNLKDSVLGQAYMNQNKIDGIDLADKSLKEKIYNQYVESFKVGAADYIREEYDPQTQQVIPKKYFSGGLTRVGKVDLASMAPDVKVSSAYHVELRLSDGNKAMLTKQNPIAPADKRRVAQQIAKIEHALGNRDRKLIREKIKKVISALERNTFGYRLRGMNNDVIAGFSEDAPVIGSTDTSVVHLLGYIHQTVNLIVLSPDGKELVLQRRDTHSPDFPGFLSLSGGHLDPGEDYEHAAVRELEEEMGIHSEIGELISLGYDLYDVHGDNNGSEIKRNNRERRKLYAYVLSETEYAKVKGIKRVLDDKLRELGYEQYKAWLKMQDEKHDSPYGECFSIHFLQIEDVLSAQQDEQGNRFITMQEGDKDSEDVSFTPDLLKRVIEDKDLVGHIKEIAGRQGQTMVNAQAISENSASEKGIKLDTTISVTDNFEVVVMSPEGFDQNNFESYETNEFLRFCVNQEDGRVQLFVAYKNSDLVRAHHRDQAWKVRVAVIKLIDDVLKNDSSWKEGDINGVKALEVIPIKIVKTIAQEALGPKATEKDVLDAFFGNSQIEFERLVRAYRSGQDTYNVTQYPNMDLQGPDYSHLRHFAWIYHQEILQLERILRQTDQQVTVVDLGAGCANYILTAAAILSPEDLSRIDFVAIDRKMVDMDIGRAMAEKIGLNVKWIQDDVTDSEFMNRLAELSPGQVVMNHVLEHVPGRPEDYLTQLLNVAKFGVSAAVPLEDSLETTISDHEHEFSVRDIEGVASQINHAFGKKVAVHNLEETRFGGLWVFDKASDKNEVLKKIDKAMMFVPVVAFVRLSLSNLQQIDSGRIYALHEMGINLKYLKRTNLHKYDVLIQKYNSLPVGVTEEGLTEADLEFLRIYGTIFNESYYQDGEISGYVHYDWGHFLPDLIRSRVRAIVEGGNINKDEKILDYGSALGFYVWTLRSMGFDAHGIDISTYAVTQDAPDGLGQYLSSFEERDILNKLKSADFNFIIIKDVLEHVPVKILPRLLMTLSRVGQRAFIMLPFVDEQRRFVDPADEQDLTHVLRKSKEWWLSLLGEHYKLDERVNYALKGEKSIGTLSVFVDFDESFRQALLSKDWSKEDSGNIDYAMFSADTNQAMMKTDQNVQATVSAPGGIDLSGKDLKLDEQGQKIKFDFSGVDQAQLQNLKGLKPVIIGVEAVTPAMLNRLLGRAESEDKDPKISELNPFKQPESLAEIS